MLNNQKIVFYGRKISERKNKKIMKGEIVMKKEKELTEKQRKELIRYGYFNTKLTIETIFGFEYTRDERIMPKEINGKLELVAESFKRNGQHIILKAKAWQAEVAEIIKEQEADRKMLIDYWEAKEKG